MPYQYNDYYSGLKKPDTLYYPYEESHSGYLKYFGTEFKRLKAAKKNHNSIMQNITNAMYKMYEKNLTSPQTTACILTGVFSLPMNTFFQFLNSLLLRETFEQLNVAILSDPLFDEKLKPRDDANHYLNNLLNSLVSKNHLPYLQALCTQEKIKRKLSNNALKKSFFQSGQRYISLSTIVFIDSVVMEKNKLAFYTMWSKSPIAATSAWSEQKLLQLSLGTSPSSATNKFKI